MKPIRREQDNVEFGPPGNWDEAKFGPCKTISGYVGGDGVEFAYRPNPLELDRLKRGEVIILTFAGKSVVPHHLTVSQP